MGSLRGNWLMYSLGQALQRALCQKGLATVVQNHKYSVLKFLPLLRTILTLRYVSTRHLIIVFNYYPNPIDKYYCENLQINYKNILL